ncbi:uncharacterized protein VTP21DRAFT_2525 [Calcarisporiella thermophila]|uniref:uncharacterized protein n=1 Tax=Calcarisporiella thermophila TaxID=911321 RepID=UPI0037433AC5
MEGMRQRTAGSIAPRSGASTQSSSRPTQPRTRIQRFQSSLPQLVITGGLLHFFDVWRVVVKSEDDRVNLLPLVLAAYSFVGLFGIFFYLTIFQGMNKNRILNWRSERTIKPWVQISSLLGLVGFILFVVAVWPVWGAASFLVFGSLMVFVVTAVGLAL